MVCKNIYLIWTSERYISFLKDFISVWLSHSHFGTGSVKSFDSKIYLLFLLYLNFAMHQILAKIICNILFSACSYEMKIYQKVYAHYGCILSFSTVCRWFGHTKQCPIQWASWQYSTVCTLTLFWRIMELQGNTVQKWNFVDSWKSTSHFRR